MTRDSVNHQCPTMSTLLLTQFYLQTDSEHLRESEVTLHEKQNTQGIRMRATENWIVPTRNQWSL